MTEAGGRAERQTRRLGSLTGLAAPSLCVPSCSGHAKRLRPLSRAHLRTPQEPRRAGRRNSKGLGLPGCDEPLAKVCLQPFEHARASGHFPDPRPPGGDR